MSIFQNSQTNKKLNLWLPILFASILGIGMSLGYSLKSASNSSGISSSNQASTKRVDELIRYIEAKYVDTVDTKILIDKAIESILKELDPHSNYIPPEYLAGVNEDLDGNFEGVGIQFVVRDDTIYVVSAIEGGPSQQQGIRSGDKIIYIGDSLVAGNNINSAGVVDKLKGKKGTTVHIKIKRSGQKELLAFKITRDKIPIYSVDASYMLNPNTGYIKISRFSATTHKEFIKQVKELEKKGLKNIVIDLRQNPGGYLHAATKILDQLFNDESLLVYTEGLNYNKTDYKAKKHSFFKLDQVALLIDEGSASASEIMAGAIQDWDRGPIIGRRSFGKGLVQEQYRLSNGGALRLTIARYYTPSGRSIQKPYEDRKSYNNEMYDRLQSGELSSQDSVQIGDTTKYFTKEGRIVYGGGGIMPDFFIPINPVMNNSFYGKSMPHVAPFVYAHLDNHRDDYRKFETINQFKKEMIVSDQLLEEFLQYLKKEKVKQDSNLYNQCKNELARNIKAHLAKQYFSNNGFYEIMNDNDDMIKKALKEFETNK